MLGWPSSISARPVYSHEGYSNFFRSRGRAVSSERLYRAGRHQRSLSRVRWGRISQSTGVVWGRSDSEVPIYRGPDHRKTVGDGFGLISD